MFLERMAFSQTKPREGPSGIFACNDTVCNLQALCVLKFYLSVDNTHFPNIFNLKKIGGGGGKGKRAIKKKEYVVPLMFLAQLLKLWRPPKTSCSQLCSLNETLWHSLITTSNAAWWMAPPLPLFWIRCDTWISLGCLVASLRLYVGSLIEN